MVNKYTFEVSSKDGAGRLLDYLDKNAFNLTTDPEGTLYRLDITTSDTFVRVKIIPSTNDVYAARAWIQTNAEGGVQRASRDLANLLEDVKAELIQ
jgi:hypothetical protein